MTATTIVPASPAATSPPVPRWTRWAAHTVPLTVLPSGLWRIALGFGVPVGFSGDLAVLYHAPGWITLYVILLSLIVEGLALLTLGLVQPWGEVVPRWIPRLGGRRVPTMAAVISAALGAIAVTIVSIMIVRELIDPDTSSYDPSEAPQGLAAWVMGLCYAPMVAWGPLLAAVTIAYYRRRTRAT
jgi:hypothetical protein